MKVGSIEHTGNKQLSKYLRNRNLISWSLGIIMNKEDSLLLNY